MAELKPGDIISCLIKDKVIVSTYKEHDTIQDFEILATDFYGYYLYVPHYCYLEETFEADDIQCFRLGIDPKFTNSNIIYIQGSMVHCIKSILDGMICKNCREFYQYSEANQADQSFICFSCKFNPYR